MLFAGHVTNRTKSTLGGSPKLKLPFLQKMIYLNQVLEVVHVLCTSGLYPQPSIAMERNAPQLYGACQFMLSGDVQFKDAYNTLRDTLEQNKAFVIPEYIKRPIFKASKRGGSPIHIFLLWTFLYSSQQHLNLPPSEGQGHFFVKGNVVSHQLNTKRPLDSVYISNGETTTKVTNLVELRLPDDQLAIVNIYTLSLAVLKTINRPHTGHPEALKRWASYTSFKTAQKNPTLTVRADPKKKRNKPEPAEKTPKSKRAVTMAAKTSSARPQRAATTKRRSKRNKADVDESYDDDNDDSEDEEDVLDEDEFVTTSERSTIKGKTNSSISTPTSATFQEMYTVIAALQPLVAAIDNVQDERVKNLCASAAKVALESLNRGASTDYTTLKEAMEAMDADNVTSTKRNLFLTREDLIGEIIDITMNENVDMEYKPTLKEVMAVFPSQKKRTFDPQDDDYKEKFIFYKGDFVPSLWSALHSDTDGKPLHEPIASLVEVMRKATSNGWISSIDDKQNEPQGDLLVLADEDTWGELESASDDEHATGTAEGDNDSDDSTDSTPGEQSGGGNDGEESNYSSDNKDSENDKGGDEYGSKSEVIEDSMEGKPEE